MSKRTITTAGCHGYKIGEQLSLTLTEPDRRWWRRAWFWITGRRHPMRDVKYGATVTSATTLSIE
ncbi:MAG: hypothetical protein ING31_12205 [Burkholderiales bacterium]|nr:hypothetical protein [Burkholderiales bacterium]